jgi:hypothetical protein
MCIAILNTKKAGKLPKSHIKNSWENNDMGAGLLWSSKGKLHVFKTYDYDEFLEKYNKIRGEKSTGSIVLHFRIATSGYNGEHNLHPFLVNDNLGFVHNGVISGLGNKDFSDTYEFNDMLKKYKHDFIKCEMSRYFISEYIGYSKLIFLSAEDRYTIINEELGKWTDGNWYSNDSYKEIHDFSYYGNKKVAKSKLDTYDPFFDDEVLISADDEWEMYEYICDVYGLDPNDMTVWDDIEYYMQINQCVDIPELYKLLSSYETP